MVKNHKKVVSFAILACLSMYALMAKKPYGDEKSRGKKCAGSACNMNTNSPRDMQDNSMKNTMNKEENKNNRMSKKEKRNKQRQTNKQKKNKQNSM